MRTNKLVALCTLAAIALTACGGDDEEPTAQLTASESTTGAPTTEPSSATARSDGEMFGHTDSYPVPTEVGEFGDITIDGVTYFAELRSCMQTLDDEARVRAYDVFDEATGTNLTVVTVTYDDAGIAFDVYDPHQGENGVLIHTGRADGEAGEGDRTYGSGTFETGVAFEFGLVLFVEDCGDDAIVEEPEPAPAPATEAPAEEPGRASGGQYTRPPPTQDGNWGTMQIEGANYGAVRRSCEDVGDHGVAQVFEVVDGQTNNVLHVEFITENGQEWSVAMYPGMGGSSSDPPRATGRATTSGGNADRTSGRGTWDDGRTFTFDLVFGGDRC